MTQIPSLAGTGLGTSQNQQGGNSLAGLDLDHFLRLMIAELQNQDPLNPLENAQLLQQISQIREVGATDKLTSTLDAVLLGQNVSSATNLIGKQVSGIDDKGSGVEGVVDRVTIAGGKPKLHVGAAQVSLPNVREVSTT